MQYTINLTVSFPLLDAYLVEHLKQQDTTQAKVDAAATAITNLTGRLRASSVSLAAEVAEAQQQQ